MTPRRHELAEAAAELDAAVEWYAQKRALLAIEFLNAVEAGIAHVSDWPKSAGTCGDEDDQSSGAMLRKKRVKGFPYSIVYLMDGDDLVIVAYPHDKQRPGYWKARIRR